MPARQEIAFQPSLALVLAEHFHHAAVRRQMVVVGKALRHPSAIGDFHRILPAV